jgi:phosphoribosylaminoimidazole-succinocarboxamide synthase
MTSPLHTSHLRSLPLLSRGKVRDIYAVDDKRLLIVQSDRISAFDVVMNEPVPNKGAILTEMSYHWFHRLESVVAHHLLPDAPESVVSDAEDRQQVAGRSMLVKRLLPLPIEAVCRGYLVGSGWKDYCATGAVCGITLPEGLQLAQKLPTPIFTPATKAEQGEHDENISFDEMAKIVGQQTAHDIREASLRLYTEATAKAEQKGIIIADTKFEFALQDGNLILIDEVLTPDSSRYWDIDSWRVGSNPDSYDKQHLRDWLDKMSWNKKPPPPAVPAEVLGKTAEKYGHIRDRLLGD